MDKKQTKRESNQELQNINLNYIFNLVQWIISSASQTGTIAHDFIKKHGEGDNLVANLICRDQKKAEEAARIIGEVAKLKSAYLGS